MKESSANNTAALKVFDADDLPTPRVGPNGVLVQVRASA
jgi:hypothetical protein